MGTSRSAQNSLLQPASHHPERPSSGARVAPKWRIREIPMGLISLRESRYGQAAARQDVHRDHVRISR